MWFLCKYITRAGVSAESLSKLKVCIPDLETQQQIVDFLLALRTSSKKEEEAVQCLQRFKKS